MPLILMIYLKLFFALKVTIYLQSMSIQCRLVRLDYKGVISLIFVYRLSPSIINYGWPKFRTTCAIVFQQEFELLLQFHPTVILMANVNSCFIIIRQNFFPVSFSSRISDHFRPTASADIFFHKNRLSAYVVKGHLKAYE